MLKELTTQVGDKALSLDEMGTTEVVKDVDNLVELAQQPEVIKIVNATAGRAFVLSTSFAGMNELYERVASQIDYPCFLQGTASKSALLTVKKGA